ncbi:MAG: ATP-binding protein [Rubrivivax sp.]|nr:ATP-binding protein [Rubrivivax sp.]
MNDSVAAPLLMTAARADAPLWLAAAQLGARLAELLRAQANEGDAATWARELGFLDAHAARAQTLAHELQASASQAEPPALARLADTLGLDDDERCLLVLAAMPELHEGFGAAFAALHPRGETRPTWALFSWLVTDDLRRPRSWQLLQHSPVLQLGLVRIVGDTPLPERNLRLAEGMACALNGAPEWPESLAPLPELPDLPDFTDLPARGAADAASVEANDWLARPAPQQALALLSGDTPALVALRGPVAAVVRLRARQLAAALDAHVFAPEGEPGDGRGAPAAAAQSGSTAALVDRVRQCLQQCLLRGCVSVWLFDAPPPAAVAALLESWPAPLVLAGALPGSLAHSTRALLTLDATPLSGAALARLWAQALPELAPHGALIGARYAVLPETLAHLRRDLQPWLATGATPPLPACLAALKARTTHGSDGFALRLVPRASWSDLVLPPDRMAALRGAVERMQHQQRVLDDWGFARHQRGARGLRLLFSGLPGTGKTLAAEVMAHALHADLLVIDLAQLVSKWIGETEKNLAAAFDQAEGTGAVLFFDEADALFGKRTEVSDAHDRYANIESAYLLARLERFDGVAILATNLRGNLDKAFLRRFELALEFAEPAAPERAAIWRAQFPPAAPLAGDLDFDSLAAQHPLPGALIRNAALGAAFIAAAAGQAIGRHHIEQALQMEYDKSGRVSPH